MSSKYTFIQEFTDEDGQVHEVKHTFYAVTHDEIAARFNEFLRGSGFYFYDGESYQLIGDEDTYSTTEAGDELLHQFDEGYFDEQFDDHEYHFDDLPQNNWPFTIGNKKCSKCGMTREQMGDHACYEKTGCGLGLDGTL
jgi:hypothetical protein